MQVYFLDPYLKINDKKRKENESHYHVYIDGVHVRMFQIRILLFYH